MLSAAWTSNQFIWAAQYGHVTTTLRKLGWSDSLVGFLWLVGPISGILIQPVIGAKSDRCTSAMGPRRPFLLVGLILVALTSWIFGNAVFLGRYFGDPADGSSTTIAAFIATAAFFLQDCSLNCFQGPLRALLADALPPSWHAAGNSALSLASGLGFILGYGLGAIDLLVIFPFFLSQDQAVFCLASVTTIVIGLPAVIWIKEKPLDPSSIREQSTSERCSESFPSLSVLPSALRLPFLAQLATFAGWFCFKMYVVEFVAVAIYRGSADAAPGSKSRDDFEDGVRYANQCLCTMSILFAIVSSFTPRLLRKMSLQTLWAVALLVGVFALGTCWLVDSAFTAAIMITLLGIPFSAAYSVPWTLVTVAAGSSTATGKITAAFNLSQCIPEVVVAISSGFFFSGAEGSATGGAQDETVKLRWVLTAGAISLGMAAVTAMCAFFLCISLFYFVSFVTPQFVISNPASKCSRGSARTAVSEVGGASGAGGLLESSFSKPLGQPASPNCFFVDLYCPLSTRHQKIPVFHSFFVCFDQKIKSNLQVVRSQDPSYERLKEQNPTAQFNLSPPPTIPGKFQRDDVLKDAAPRAF